MAEDSVHNEFELHNALICGSRDDVMQVLKGSKNVHIPNDNGLYPIHVAVQRNTNDVTDVLDILAENGADMNSRTVVEGDTPLHITLRLSSLDHGEDIILKLLSKGADPDIRNRKLRSAYDLAINHGFYSLLDVLSGEVSPESYKKDRASLSKRNKSKEIIAAILDGDFEKIKDFAPNTDLNYKNEFGYSSIHYLITKAPATLPKQEVLELLLSNGCDVNLVNHDMDTPLLIVLKTLKPSDGMVELVKCLMDNGADGSTKDKNGLDALQLAENNHYDDVIEIMKPKPKQEDDEMNETESEEGLENEEEDEDKDEEPDEEDKVKSEDDEEVPWGI